MCKIGNIKIPKTVSVKTIIYATSINFIKITTKGNVTHGETVSLFDHFIDMMLVYLVYLFVMAMIPSNPIKFTVHISLVLKGVGSFGKGLTFSSKQL